MKFLLLLASIIISMSTFANSLTKEQQNTYGSYFGVALRCAVFFDEADSPEKSQKLKSLATTMVATYKLDAYQELKTFKDGYESGVTMAEENPKVCETLMSELTK